MGSPACPYCGPALSALDFRPEALRVIHGHRLFVVVGGTTWRLWRAPNAFAAQESFREWSRRYGVKGIRFRVRLARASDLESITEAKVADVR